jgi:hypothetical protein
MDFQNVNLIEPMAKNILHRTLQKCHDIKTRYFSIWLNLIVFVGFSIVLGFILYFRYKGQPSEYEKKRKLLKDQQYVLSKIRFYHDEKKRASYSSLPELPIQHPEYDIAMRQLYHTVPK